MTQLITSRNDLWEPGHLDDLHPTNQLVTHHKYSHGFALAWIGHSVSPRILEYSGRR